MTMPVRILYCHCAYAQVVPKATKEQVLRELAASGAQFDAVPDLCEMSARKDPALKQYAGCGGLKVAACYPRAVKWLFAAAQADLHDDAQVLNMRNSSPEQVLAGLLDGPQADAEQEQAPAQAAVDTLLAGSEDPPRWKPWFPVIDFARCTNCMQCLSFCLFDVYGVSTDGRIQVQNQVNCKTDCPACSRVCPEVAIMFPKYRSGPINGEEVSADDVRREAMKVDISALLGGDIYSALRDRSAKARSRFSTERDEDRALKERQRCLTKLTQDLDIPPEVLSSLPSLEQIRARADEAKLRAEQALQQAKEKP
jgi:NAD-dependent dihydropyrimidine dehydrogenase PreA subunit